MNKYWLYITVGVATVLLVGIAIPKLTVHDLVSVDEQLQRCVAYAVNDTYDNPFEHIALFLGKSRIITADRNDAGVESFTLFRIPLGVLRGQLDSKLGVTCDFAGDAVGSAITDPYLPLPQNLPEGWYAHRITDTSFFITRQKVLPDIGATETYAYGDQVGVYITINTLSPEIWMAQRSGFDLNDVALIKSKIWTESHGHPLLQVEHQTPASDQLTDFLFVGDRVYTISLYPYPGGEGLGIFNTFIDSYSADRTHRAISYAELAANCKKEIPPGADDSSIDLQIGVVTFNWWDYTLQDNVSLTVPYEPETGFVGCSESIKAKLKHIQEANDSGIFPRQ